ncbi:MAG: hypothetical protein ACYSTR_07285, partial [Planctomycetota bacterium]
SAVTPAPNTSDSNEIDQIPSSFFETSSQALQSTDKMSLFLTFYAFFHKTQILSIYKVIIEPLKLFKKIPAEVAFILH